MSGILDHDARRTMLTALARTPVLTVGEVADELGVHYKTALHHARRLARAGHVVLERRGARPVVRLPGVPAARGPAPRTLQAMHAVAAGARTPAALARALGIPRGSAGSLLVRLERAGLLVRRSDGYAPVAPEAFTTQPSVGAAWNADSSAR